MSVALLLALTLAGLAALPPRTALAVTIVDCSDLAAVKTTLEAGGNIVIDCGVITLDVGSEIVIDSDTAIDGLGQTTLTGDDTHRVIYVDASENNMTVTLRGLAIVDGMVDTITDTMGGGVLASVTSGNELTLHLETMTFSGNTADYAGGAVGVFSSSGSAHVTATETTFSGNTAGASGGAIMDFSTFGGSTTFEVTTTTFSSNTVDQGGGAVLSRTALDGSAVFTATNTTFSANISEAGGAAVQLDIIDGGSSTFEATNTTFADNALEDVDDGATIFASGEQGVVSVTLASTIIADSTENNCFIVGGATLTSNDYNLADDDTCDLTNTNDQITDDAGLAPLANNGGPTETHALQADSPAIDAIPTGDCAVATDQRGVFRPLDGNGGGAACDIGAFEAGEDTSPTVGALLDPASPSGNAPWYTGNVSIDWTVTDPESPVEIVEGCLDQTISSDTPATGLDLLCRATSVGGETLKEERIYRDATPPTNILFLDDVGGASVTDGGVYPFGSVPPAPICKANDAISGMASCVVTGYSTERGSHTLTATATDVAGNQATATISYTVERFTTRLLGTSLPPYQRNQIVAGTTLYVYFAFDPTGQTGVLASARVGTVPCGSTATPTTTQAAAVSAPVYQQNYQRYMLVWKTDKNWLAGCRQLVLTFVDGSVLRLNVQVVRLSW
jgi:hypothetical protein